MITDINKDEVFNTAFFYYTSIRFNKDNLSTTFYSKYKNAEDFKNALYKENTRIFFRYAVTLKGIDFINCIKNEYKLFCTYSNPDKVIKLNWLNTTKNFIVNINDLSGFINKSDIVLFVKWYDKTIKKLEAQQNEIIKNIELYKNCVNPIFFESYNHKTNKDQTANNLYYFNRLTDNYTSLKNEIETNEAYKNYKNEALEFLVKEKSLILKTIKFLISCSENKNTANIQLQWYKIEDQIKSIKNTINVIEYFKINNDYVKAIELKDFIKYRLNTVIIYFESFTIYLNKTPIETLINDLISDFNNCIDVSEISQINALKTIPQQVENIKPDEVKKKLHNHIFKNNAFEVWQSMFDEFEINEKSRTDVKFMFEEMKKEELIHNTVNQTTFLEWITSTYDGLIVIKTSNHSRSKPRLQAYSRAIQLYKK